MPIVEARDLDASLLDGDGRRKAVDLVDVRLLHHFRELAGVSREQLDIAPLALGIDGVEGERGFPRTREPGEHHQLVPRDGSVEVLEVVLARAADHDRPAAEQSFDGFGRVLGRAERGAPANWVQP